jgi:polyhydroxyalkanoate synthase
MSIGNGNDGGNPWTQTYEAMVDEGLANFRRFSKVPALYKKALRVKKGTTPSEVVYREKQIRLLNYTSEEEPKYKTPLIFVFALVNRPYILDLKPGKSVVSHFVNAGFDTYLVDWGVPTNADQHRTLEDYVDRYLMNIVNEVRERTGSEKVNILGYCMGGTMSSMFTALNPDLVQNLILLAAGIDFETRDGLLNVWTDPEYFDVDAFIDTYGNCPAEFLQASFLYLKPIQNLIQKPIGFIERMDNEKFVDDFFTMEMWINDNIPVPGEVYRKFVKDLYQKNLLVKGQFKLGRRTVNLKDITCPILNLVAEKDDLVPCGQSTPFNDLVGSSDRKTMTLKAGHIGLAVGSRAQRDLWPAAVEWLGERSAEA